MSEFNAWTSKGDLEEGRYEQHLHLHQWGDLEEVTFANIKGERWKMEGISNIIGERWKADVLDMSNVHRIGTNLTRPQSILHKCTYTQDLLFGMVHQLQVREDDAWMKSTAVVNKEERELLFKAYLIFVASISSGASVKKNY